MRTREEIEKIINLWYPHNAVDSNRLILELLLDIRELLQPKTDAKEYEIRLAGYSNPEGK